MNDNVVFTMIGIVYAASSGGLFYVTKNFLTSDITVKQSVNLPLARIKEENVSDILELLRNFVESLSIPALGTVEVYQSHRNMVERFYKNMSERLSKKAELVKCCKRLKLTKTLAVFNIVLSVFILFYIVFSLVSGALETDTNLEVILHARLLIFMILFLMPWAIFVAIYFLCRKYETYISSTEVISNG